MKIVGLAIGERSLLAAELVGADPPVVKHLAEMVYPDGMSLDNPAELGKALGQFLRDNQFTAHAAVIGIPAKWLVVKSKEVPPTDRATLIEMLRLQAEAEFAADLKDLVYDFAGATQESAGRGTTPVLLMATPKKYVDSVSALCEAAGLRAMSVTPSALALGEASTKASDKNVLVLSVGPGGSELSAQQSGAASAIRYLRSPGPQSPFVSELRRAVSTLGPASADREMILWSGAGMDAGGLDAAALGDQLGLRVRGGELPSLGVDASGAGMNGQSSKFAAAIAVALAGMNGPAVDFLHSHLAPPQKRSMQRMIVLGALAAVVVIGGILWAYVDMRHKQAHVADLQSKLAQIKDKVADARTFVDTVNFAQHWHGENPKYLECLRDLTNAVPEDGQTYATSLDITAETPHMAVNPPPGTAAPAPKAQPPHGLTVKLAGRTSDAENVTTLVDRMRRNPAFVDIRIGQETNTGRSREWSFSLTFTYVPPERK